MLLIAVAIDCSPFVQAVFRGELQRIGRYEHHGGNKTARSIRIPEEVSASAEMSGEKEAMKRVKNLMEIRHLNGLRQEAEVCLLACLQLCQRLSSSITCLPEA